MLGVLPLLAMLGDYASRSKSNKSPGGVTANTGGSNPAMGSTSKIPGLEGTFAQFPQFAQNQLGLLNQLTDMSKRQLSQKGGPIGPANGWQQYFNFAPIEQQARTQFHEQTIPSLAERFTAMGGEGGQRSSAFQGALGRAGSNLEQGLAALKAQYALPQSTLYQNQRGQELNLLQTLLSGGTTPQTQNAYFPAQPTGWAQAAGSLSETAGQMLPMFARMYMGG